MFNCRSLGPYHYLEHIASRVKSDTAKDLLSAVQLEENCCTGHKAWMNTEYNILC